MKKILQSLFIIMAIVGFSSQSAKAETFPTDGSAIELGVSYEVQAYKSYSATLTVTETGVLLQDGCADLELAGLEKSYVGYGSYGQIWSWNVEAGTTYTIEAGFVMNGGNVCFNMESAKGVELVYSYPEENQVLSPNSNGTGTIDLVFGSSVNFDEAYLVAGDEQQAIPQISSPENYISLSVTSVMAQMYASGALNEDGGTPITLKILGLRTSSGTLYNGDGVLEITYVASPKLVELVSSTLPNTFKSYYPEGSAEGMLEFVFDRDLITDGSITLLINCGNPEVGSYNEELPVKVDGTKATADLCGVLRDLSSYLASQGNNLVQVRLRNVKDINGQEAAGQGEGNTAAYPFYLNYEYLAPVNIVSEFTPASGESLKGAEEIEIWFNNADAILFDGVKITYDDGGALKTLNIPNADLNIERSSNDVTITLAVPEEIKGKTRITVTLDNMVSLDGHDYDIAAYYDQFVAQLLSPIKAGEAIASTGDTDFIFNLNIDNTILYVRYDFYNGEEEGDWAGGAQLYKESNGTFSAYNGNFTCYTNFDPYMIVRAYYNENNYWQGIDPAYTYRIDFKGTTSPFEFSDVKFVDIDPANQSVIEPSEDFCWTIQFDGLVSIDNLTSGVVDMLGIMPFERIEAEELVDGLANTWHLYPGYEYLSQQQFVNLNIVAYDIDGALVEGNEGEGQYSSLQFSYEVHSAENMRELTVTPATQSTVDAVSEFVLSYDNMAVGINYNYTGEQKVALYTRAMDLVYTFEEDDMELVSDITGEDELGQPIYDTVTRVVLKVNPAITEPGGYVLIIPENYFLVGSEFDTYANMEYFGIYYIEAAPAEDVELTVNPAAGEVSALTRIDIDAKGIDEAVCWDAQEDITITDAEGNTVFTATGSDLDATSFDFDTWSFLGYYIEPNITEPGVYTLHIPAGFFTFADDSVNIALEVVYTVTTSGITSVGVEKADSYTVYTIGGVLVLKSADASALSTLAPGFYVINGKKVLVK